MTAILKSKSRMIPFSTLILAIEGILVGLSTTNSPAAPSDSNYRLVFSDEFNGTTLETSKWSAASPGWTMPNSASTASAAQVGLGNGELTLNGTRTNTGNSFSSGSISSYQKYTMTSGYIEARIDLPSTVGSWPAFWGLYDGWPPEMDIMEYPLSADGGTNGYLNNAYHTAYHYLNGSGAAAAGAGKVTINSTNLGTTGYHTFGMKWVDDTSVAFFFDGSQVSSFTNASVNQMNYMYMILDYAIGGWPTTPSTTQWPVGFSDNMKIDWVRTWQYNPNADAASTWNINGGGSFATAGNWSGAGVPAFGNQPVIFGRVGAAATSIVTLGTWQVMGNLTFSGDGTGTTAYTIGTTASTLQLSSTAGSSVTASSTSTVAQTVGAKVDLVSNTTFRNDMTAGQSLIFSGGVNGPGQLTVEGAGTVILSASGNYSGGTAINGGAAGPGVLRVSAKNAMGTGTVVIGAAGNGTTARLETTGNNTQPNNIDFRARNNNSVGIQNISGNNTLSGTIGLGAGGSIYQIQSDSGTLTLSGTSPQATARGVAIQNAATSARTVTLQGAGNGNITGIIRNGTNPVSLVKDGTGTWTLSAANTYTGTTTITGGTLRLSNPATTTIPTPIAKYTFANVSGTTVLNDGSGGAALNGTLNPNGGTGTINITGGPAAGLGSLNLNGTGTTVDINSGVTDLGGSSSWTVSTWVKTTQLGATIFNKGDGASWGNGFSTFYLGSGNSAGIGGVADAVRYAGGWVAGTTPVADGNWHLLTYTNAGGSKAIYVDGIADSLSQTSFINADTGTKIRIGFSPTTQFDGNVQPNASLSGMNFYNSALNAAQVATLYNNTFTASGSALPSSTTVSIASGATLDVNGTQQTIASLTGVSGSSITLGAGQLTVNTTASTTYAGNISGLSGTFTKSGSGTLTASGTLSYTGATNVTGGKLITFNGIKNNAAMNISNGGNIEVPVNGSGSGVISISALSIGATSKLELHDNDLIVNYGLGGSSYSTIINHVKNGLQLLGGAGTQGITSVEVDAQTLEGTVLAVVDNGDPNVAGGITSLSGYIIPNPTQSVLVKYTWFGDANLDGMVDGSDYALIDTGFTSGGALDSWVFGDFDTNGLVDGGDYALIDTGFIAQNGTLPEPASLMLIGLGVAGMLRRRSRQFLHEKCIWETSK